jgi:toxin ParE1/3/4
VENSRLIVSPAARRDLRTIRRHSERLWGTAKTDSYLELLWESIESLMAHPERGRIVSPDQPKRRRLTVSRHIIYYRLAESTIEILRIVHERRDVAALLD